MTRFTKLSLTLTAAAVCCASAFPAFADGTVPTARAYQMGSKDSKWGFVSFPVNNIDAKTITKTTYSSDDQIGAGEVVDGKLYAYTLSYDYLFGDGLEPSEFVVYNAADMSVIKSVPAPNSGRVVDMSYDYKHNVMYALMELNRAENGALGKTALHAVDLTTGKLTLIGLPGNITAVNGNGKTVEEHLIALACNPTDGTIYAMGEYRQLYKLDRFTGQAVSFASRKKIAITNDFQSMSFGPDGKLYHAHMHPDYEYFMQIDPATGALYNPVTGDAVTVNSDFTNNAARFDQDPQLTALTFDMPANDNKVPNAVSNLKATVAADNANTVNLSWVLPTTYTVTDGVAELTTLNIRRLGENPSGMIVNSPATSPNGIAYTDYNVPNGEVTYMIYAESAENTGIPAFVTLFVGADQLQAVGNLNAALSGNEVTLTWTAPTATVNGGYSDYDNITYTVKQVKGSDETLLAEGVNGTTYTAALDENGTYSFRVCAVSCGVSGVAAESNEVTLQGVETLPYNTGFEDNDGGTLWTAYNPEGSNYGWSIVSGYAYQQLSGKFAQFKTGGSATFPELDYWLVSPAIHCPAGDYTLSFYANGGSYDTHAYKVFIGTDPMNSDDALQVIYALDNEKVYGETDENNHYVLVSNNFTLDTEGDYRLAFRGIGASTYATLKIDNLSLVCTRQVSVDGINADAQLTYDAATRTVTCPEAVAIEAYDMSGIRVGHAAGTSLAINAKGMVVVKVTTAEGVMVRKLAVR